MRLLLVTLLAACGDEPMATLGGPCSLTDECNDGEVCDFTADGGPICISASGDIDADGLANDKDFCNHAAGGAADEDRDGIGDDCDKCPIAAPRDTPDADGDAVDAPCDPDPREPGDEILLFDSFTTTLDPRWKPTTASAWEVRGGEVIATLSAISNQEYLTTIVIGKASIAIEASYRIDKVESSSTQHLVHVIGKDPRPAGVSSMECGVTHTDGGAGDLVIVDTNQSSMILPVTNAFDSARLYRAGGYVSGITAGCSVLGDGSPLGTVQASITPDQLTSVGLTAQGVTARYQYILIVGR